MNSENFFRKTVCILLGTAAACALVFADNPIISHRFTADPNAMVYGGRVYVYCSNDDDNNGSYGLSSYILISSDDMVNWTDHGEIFRVPGDASWASRAYAPTAIERDGKFYLYFPDGGNSVGVAVADRIEGPYEDPLGKPLIEKSMPNCDVQWLFDPGVFLDDDGQAYLYFGGGAEGTGKNLRGIKLNDDMISVEGSAVTINAPESFEASFMHKYDGKYYFSYATTSSSKIDYLIGDDPLGPFTHQGTLLQNPTLDGQNINRGNNSHSSIIEYNEQWYLFYHDRRISNEVYKRNASADILEYNSDGTIKPVKVTAESLPQIKNFNPYDTVQCETIDKQSGIETDKCSEGSIMLTDIDNGDYTSLSGVDFGDGATKFKVRASSKSGGGTVELHLGSKNGDMVGTCEITETGSWDTWETFDCKITDCKGITDLYFVYKGSGEPFRLNWFMFESPATDVISLKRHKNHRVDNKRWLSVAVQDRNMLPQFRSSMFTLSGRTLQKNLRKNFKGKSKGVYIIEPKRY